MNIRKLDDLIFFTQIGSDIDGEASGDQLGRSVSISYDGSIVAIGSPHNEGIGYGSHSGNVRIFRNINNSWSQIGNDIDGVTPSRNLGHSVSISADGSVVVFGGSRARIYKNLSGIWEKTWESTVDNYSHRSVSISSDGSVVALGSSAGRYIRIYENLSGNWTQIGSDIYGEENFDYSGQAVSLSADGSLVAIGSWINDSNGENSGHLLI